MITLVSDPPGLHDSIILGESAPVPPPTAGAGERTEMGGIMDGFVAYHHMRGWSRATIKRRRLTLGRFAAHIAPRKLGEATRADVEAFLAEQPTPRTRHAYRSDLRVFYAWALDRELLDHDPTTKVERVKVPKSLPRPLRPAAVEAAIATARPTVRVRIALGFYAGLRAGEIAAMRADDIDVAARTLIVRDGKGGKDRIIDLHPTLATILEPWMPAAGFLFPGRDGRAHVTAESVAGSIVRHLARSGVGAVSHQLRHTFGSELTRVTGGDLITVGNQMGHESPETTRGYAGWAGKGRAAVAAMYGGDAA